MQRPHFFTARAEFPAAPGAWEIGRLGLPLLLGLLVLGASAAILEHPQPAVFDQARLLEARFEAPYHPSPPYGFTVQLFAMAVKALVPAGAAHQALRVAAMALWAGAAAWLASLVLERRVLVAVFLLLLFTSQYPFVWLSSELVIGGVLCLVLAAWLRGARGEWLGALLALLALCKPDMAVVAAALLACFARQAGARRLAVGCAAALAVLLLPGLVWFGPAYLTGYGPRGEGRAFAAFSQHYAALVAPFQLAPAPDPWAEPAPYLARSFPGARSMADVVAAPGLPYLEFVALSVVRGVKRAGWVFQWAWLAVPVLVWARRRAGIRVDSRERALAWTFAGLVPCVLFAYPHVRYFARWYPIFWILVFACVERVAREAEPRVSGRCLLGVGAAVALALAVNAERAGVGLAAAPHLGQYWFPD